MIFTMLPKSGFTIRGDYEGGLTLSNVLYLMEFAVFRTPLCSTFESAYTQFIYLLYGCYFKMRLLPMIHF